MKKTGLIKTALGLWPVCVLLLTPLSNIEAATDDEVAELRAMVLALASEVQELKDQLAEKEARRDVSVPAKQEQEPADRQPLDKPAVAGVSSNYGLSFYGYFKLDAMYDSGLPSHQEIPFWVRPDTGTNGGNFEMTAKETRLGMNFAGPEAAGGTLTGKLEMDFYGNINTPSNLSGNHAFSLRTRHVYLNWDFGKWSLLAGKTWEPYIIEIPQTLNFSYYNFMGQLGLRKTQLRLTRKVGDNMELIGALIEPVGGVHGADIDGDMQDDGGDAELPVFSGKVVYKVPIFNDKPANLGLSFVYGKENIDLPPVGDPKKYDAWAVVAAFNLPLTDAITWKMSAFTGSNLDGYWGGIGQGINLARQTEIDSVGGWTQLQFKVSEKLNINLGYTIEDLEDGDLSPGMRSSNESWLINCYYSFHPAMLWGLEYFRQETGYKGGSTADNDHVHSSLIYRF